MAIVDGGGIGRPSRYHTERDLLRAMLGTRWHEFGAARAAELRRLYSTAYAFIFPSAYEGFGLPVLEAMACSSPVLAANPSALPAVGADAARHVSERHGDAYAVQLEALAGDATRNAAVAAGLARAGGFSWSRTFDQTLSVCRGLL